MLGCCNQIGSTAYGPIHLEIERTCALEPGRLSRFIRKKWFCTACRSFPMTNATADYGSKWGIFSDLLRQKSRLIIYLLRHLVPAELCASFPKNSTGTGLNHCYLLKWEIPREAGSAAIMSVRIFEASSLASSSISLQARRSGMTVGLLRQPARPEPVITMTF